MIELKNVSKWFGKFQAKILNYGGLKAFSKMASG